jgi:hypothetical protein
MAYDYPPISSKMRISYTRTTFYTSIRCYKLLVVFPSEGKLCTTVRVLKTPKTESSVRKIFIPKSVAEMLEKLKASQDEMKSILGKDYQKYDLVMATDYGLPIGEAAIRKRFKKLIKEHNLPEVVFHSLLHTSVTYKLKKELFPQ